jgi:hypothetical protein
MKNADRVRYQFTSIQRTFDQTNLVNVAAR